MYRVQSIEHGSHAATVTYKVEALRRLRGDGSCTSNLCAWNDMSKKKVSSKLCPFLYQKFIYYKFIRDALEIRNAS
jgi:hypothetical protein